ncbi:hypothetical protein Cgig2_012548 [Carnegiea gigantea]|uniref:Uncharacterized protein n=1 Tax=Carnegiea gigantea TaxID=171969 RepID=A0A9Q1JNV8_9CARY|nr:hypothetical protein Cgig2_012548 [Carnegiea gigantea]
MIDLYRDAYVDGKKCGVDVPEYFRFVFCPPGSKKKLPLQSNEDWRNLVNSNRHASFVFPYYVHLIVQQLQLSQAGPTKQPIEPIAAASINEGENDFGTPKSKSANLTVDLSEYLSAQPISTSQLHLPSLDTINKHMILEISVNLEGYLTMVMMGSFGKVVREGLMIVILMTVLMLILMLKMYKRLLKNKHVMNLDVSGSNDESDADELLNVDLEDEIPRHTNVDAEDEDGNTTENEWNKIVKTMLTIAAGAKLYLLFWTTCNVYNKHVYNQTMEAIKKESMAAYNYLLGEPVEHWARYTFLDHLKCPDNATNFVESFNEKIELFR